MFLLFFKWPWKECLRTQERFSANRAMCCFFGWKQLAAKPFVHISVAKKSELYGATAAVLMNLSASFSLL